MRKIELTIPSFSTIGKYVLYAFLALNSVAGGFTYYHFYLQPTGLVYQNTTKNVSRAALVDKVLYQEEVNKTKTSGASK